MKIGIDLGTTNSALAYIDEREAEDRDFPPLHIFETPQLVAFHDQSEESGDDLRQVPPGRRKALCDQPGAHSGGRQGSARDALGAAVLSAGDPANYRSAER